MLNNKIRALEGKNNLLEFMYSKGVDIDKYSVILCMITDFLGDNRRLIQVRGDVILTKNSFMILLRLEVVVVIITIIIIIC